MTDQVLTLNVSGMTCGGCARAVQAAARQVPGVLDASVDLATATLKARVDASRAGARELKAAVEAAGYDVLPEVR